MGWEFDAATTAWLLWSLLLLTVIAVLAWRLWRRGSRTAQAHDGLWIRIEVRNPLELARSQSRWGGQFGIWAPGLTTRRVYEVVCRELDSELAGRGVDARVELHRG